ncbi:MAG: MBL fold metallo-hydrolase [Agarilytica sp.]
MIFHIFVDPATSTKTYLLAKSKGSDAVIIDSVEDNVDEYLEFLGDNILRLVMVIDTHMHADHTSGMALLRQRTQCMTVAHTLNQAERLSRRVEHGDTLTLDGFCLEVIHTPGHTDDSCCFYEKSMGLLFTGDTLLIRGCGRTDFANGDAEALYNSITNILYRLPPATGVYPGHDYKGESFSTIGIEIETNARSAIGKDAFITLMNNLDLPEPAQMDVAVPANRKLGDDVDTLVDETKLATIDTITDYLDGSYLIVDLRELDEINKTGSLKHAVNIPYPAIDQELLPPGQINQKMQSGQKILFICAYGERSALALHKVPKAYSELCFHLKGGIENLKSHDYPLSPIEM